MSLILDALRKVERDKTGPDPGVLVLGAVPWQEARRSGRRLLLAGAAVLVVVIPALVWLVARGGPGAGTSTPATALGQAPGASMVAAPTALPPAAPTSPPPPAPRTLELPEEPGVSTAAAGEGGTEARLVLNAISERDGRPVALIDGRLVHEGDRFGDVRILRIAPSEVEIEQRGRRRTLRF